MFRYTDTAWKVDSTASLVKELVAEIMFLRAENNRLQRQVVSTRRREKKCYRCGRFGHLERACCSRDVRNYDHNWRMETASSYDEGFCGTPESAISCPANPEDTAISQAEVSTPATSVQSPDEEIREGCTGDDDGSDSEEEESADSDSKSDDSDADCEFSDEGDEEGVCASDSDISSATEAPDDVDDGMFDDAAEDSPVAKGAAVGGTIKYLQELDLLLNSNPQIDKALKSMSALLDSTHAEPKG